MLDLYDELRLLTQALATAGLRHALIGGLAVSVLTEPRATEDIDLLIAPEDWDSVRRALAPLGYADLSAPMDLSTVRLRRLTKIAGEDCLVLDLVLADEALREALDRPMALELDGVTYAVAPPDVLIALKRRRLSPRDRDDIAALERLEEERLP